VKPESTGGRTLVSGGSTLHYPTEDAYAEALGLKAEPKPKPKRTWQEAVVRYLAVKANLRSIEDVKRICRKLHPYFGHLTLDQAGTSTDELKELAAGSPASWLTAMGSLPQRT